MTYRISHDLGFSFESCALDPPCIADSTAFCKRFVHGVRDHPTSRIERSQCFRGEQIVLFTQLIAVSFLAVIGFTERTQVFIFHDFFFPRPFSAVG